MSAHHWIRSLTFFLLAAAAGYGLVHTFRKSGSTASAGGGGEAAGSGRAITAGGNRPASWGAGPAGGAASAEARDFLLRLDSAKLEDLPALWKSLPKERVMPDLHRLLLMERWAELDAPGALEFAKSQKETDAKLMVTGVFTTWGRTAPEAAMAAMKEEKDRAFQAAAALGWLRSVSEDPAALVDHASQLSWLDVSKLGRSEFLEFTSQSFLEKLYAAQPEGLKNLASWMPPWFGEMLAALDWRQLLRDDPDHALAALESMPLTEDKLGDLLAVLEPLAKTEPEKVADVLTKLTGRPGGPLFNAILWNDQRGLLESLITGVGPVDPDRIRGLLPKLEASVAGGEILKDTLLQNNPAAALKIAPVFGYIDQLAEALYPPMTPMEPDAALAAVRDAPPSYYRDKIMEQVLLKLNAENPDAAKAWIAALPEGETRDSAQLTLDMSSVSPEARKLEVVGHQAGAAEDSMEESFRKRLGMVTAMAAMADFPGTLRQVSAWPEGAPQEEALRVLGSRAASNIDPREALQWAAALPAESQRTAAYSGIAKGWTGADPVAASEWVSTLPSGPGREAAVGSFAGAIASRDPEAGWQWASTLADPQDRLTHLREVVDTWKSKDAPAAKEAIRSMPALTEADRTALLQAFQ